MILLIVDDSYHTLFFVGEQKNRIEKKNDMPGIYSRKKSFDGESLEFETG